MPPPRAVTAEHFPPHLVGQPSMMSIECQPSIGSSDETAESTFAEAERLVKVEMGCDVVCEVGCEMWDVVCEVGCEM